MDADTFFARLPEGRLSALEDKLRTALHEVASFANALLPKGGTVPLQMWVEQRMPDELVLGIDGAGLVIIEPPAEPIDLSPKREASTAPWRGAPSKSGGAYVEEFLKEEVKEDGGYKLVTPDDPFFDTLPSDDFLPQEERLRARVIELVTNGPLPFSAIIQDKEIRVAKGFLPGPVKLESWIERRVGQEIRVWEDRSKRGGKLMCKLSGPSKEEREDMRAAFWETLPADRFTPQEERLRELLLAFIARTGGAPILSQAGADKAIQAARTALLPNGVSLKNWIEQRMASDFQLDADPKGQIEIRVIGGNGQHLMSKRKGSGKEKRPYEYSGKGFGKAKGAPEDHMKGFGKDKGKRLAEEMDQPRGEELRESREAFFASLPLEDFTEEEIAMRDALLQFLDRWTDEMPPSLSNAGQDERIKACKKGLLPKGVSLQSWIEARIGAEIQMIQQETGNRECFFGVPGTINVDWLTDRLGTVSKRAMQRGPDGPPPKKPRKGQ